MSMTGLSKPRLERMHRVLSGYIERQEVPGLVALVSRHDDVHVETLGTKSVGHSAPMRRDTIFRIASLAKPVTAVAAMILVGECKLRLDESIEPWLPELASRRVLKSISSPLDHTVPALRAITVRDLLSRCSHAPRLSHCRKSAWRLAKVFSWMWLVCRPLTS
jgi:CubicO group peptidase (beta-lactamase class C family)